MVNLHNLRFFSKSGYIINIERIPKIFVEVSENGDKPFLLPITNTNGEIVDVDIIDGGNYPEDISSINIKFIENTNSFETTATIANGKITDIDLSGAGADDLGFKFSYPSFEFVSKINFDEISVNLIETEHIYVLELELDVDGDKYKYPSLGKKLSFKWTDDYTLQQDKDAYFLFTANEYEFIKKENVINGNDSLINEIGTPLQINIGTSYKSEGIFERNLEVWINDDNDNYYLGSFFLRNNIIPEDERFNTILDNLGQKINKEEEYIFRKSDINEDLPDFKLLNEKRKEFILEYSNIVPYIGSYKAIFNILNWLGYNDLQLKEYWKNIDKTSPNYNKLKPLTIPFDAHNRSHDLTSGDVLPSNTYKKTNLFSLQYYLNKVKEPGEEVDGLPEVTDDSQFTPEEVLIKLYALKSYLKNKFLPLNARIYDIVGEGVYFEKYNVHTFNTSNNIFNVEPNYDIDIIINPKNSYITNINDIEVGSSIKVEADLKKSPIVSINSDEGIIELIWNIFGPNGFKITKRDNVTNNISFEFNVPYEGDYDVELIVIDTCNNRTNIFSTDGFKVLMPEINFVSFCQLSNVDDKLEDINYNWDDVNSMWIKYNNHNTTWDNALNSWDDLDLLTYTNINVNKFEYSNKNEILSVSSMSRVIGTITNINYTDKTISIKNTINKPKIEDGEYVFFKNGEIIIRKKINISYIGDNEDSILSLSDNDDTFPIGFNKHWKIYKEINGRLKIKGDINNKTYNKLSVGDYITLKSTETKIEKIPITSISENTVTYNNSINIKKGELCMLYKERNILGLLNIDQDAKKIKFLSTENIKDEIKEGFHEITLSLEDISQRFLVDNIIKSEDIYEIKLKEIDGDLSLFNMSNAADIHITYKYNNFQGQIHNIINDNKFDLNYNNYKPHKNFKDISENEWFMDYAITYGNYSLKIKDIGLENNDTIIIVDDPDSKLYNITPSYKLNWRNFDEDYADKRLGLNNLYWDNFNEGVWNDIDSISWDMTNYNYYSYPGFIINKVNSNGKIIFNNETFTFSSDVVNIDNAILELNNSDLWPNKFIFTEEESSPNNFIKAVSKLPIVDSLGYIKFENGVEGEYTETPGFSFSYPLNNTLNTNWVNGIYGQNNKTPYWDPIYRTYIQWDPINRMISLYNNNIIEHKLLPKKYKSSDIFTSEQIPYHNALAGSFNWNETFISKDNIVIPLFTTIFFSDISYNIHNNASYNWIITNSENGNILVETNNKHLVWLFTKPGEYDISLNITDVVGNNAHKIKRGFIKVI